MLKNNVRKDNNKISKNIIIMKTVCIKNRMNQL